MPRNKPSSQGWTLIEFTVTIVVFSLLIGLIMQIYQSASQQGENQDKTTTAWTIAGQAISLLRNDVANAIELNLINSKHLELKVVTIGEDYSRHTTSVIWEELNSQSICRTENDKKQEFNFSRALNREEGILFNLKLLP